MLFGQNDEINIEKYFELQKPNLTQVLQNKNIRVYVKRGWAVGERLTLVIFFEIS